VDRKVKLEMLTFWSEHLKQRVQLWDFHVCVCVCARARARVDNIKMGLRARGCEVMGWIEVTGNRVQLRMMWTRCVIMLKWPWRIILPVSDLELFSGKHCLPGSSPWCCYFRFQSLEKLGEVIVHIAQTLLPYGLGSAFHEERYACGMPWIFLQHFNDFWKNSRTVIHPLCHRRPSQLCNCWFLTIKVTKWRSSVLLRWKRHCSRRFIQDPSTFVW
jgi:hypothetical protein